MRRSQPERDVEKSCDEYLRLFGWWPIPWKNRGVRLKDGRWVHGGIKGVPDRLAVKVRHVGNGPQMLVGAVVAVEYKSKDGAQTPDQIKFERTWQAAGLVYVIARSVADLERFGL